MFVSTFHSSKLTAQNWRIPSLASLMESLTQEQDKLVQMGTIKSTKDQSLASGVSNQSKGKNKSKYSKQQENPKSSDGGKNSRKDKEKKNEEKTK